MGQRTQKRIPVEQRLWARVAKDGPDDCWLWQGATVNGYGKMGAGSTVAGTTRTVLTHRLAYELTVGPIPDGLQLDHLCRVRLCCNPAHLEPVTAAENQQRRTRLITHCPRGHAYDEENTYVHRTQRFCLTCNRERLRVMRANQR